MDGTIPAHLSDLIAPAHRRRLRPQCCARLYIVVFMAAFAVLMYFALGTMRRTATEAALNNLEGIQAITMRGVDLWLDDKYRQVESWSDTDYIRTHVAHLLALKRQRDVLLADPATADLRRYFKPRVEAVRGRGIFIIAPDGVNIASMRDANTGEVNLIARTNRDLFESILGGQTLFIPPMPSQVPLPDETGTLVRNYPTMFIGTPVRDMRGQVAAVLMVRLDPVQVLDSIASLGGMGETGETYMFNRDAQMITRSRFAEELACVGILKPGRTGVFDLEVRDPGANLLKGQRARPDPRPLTHMARLALAGRSGRSLEPYRDYRGAMVLGAWQWHEQLGIAIATEIDVSEALATYYASRRVVIFMFLATAALAVALSFAMVRADRRSQRLQQITYVDSLTGIANRRHFDEALTRAWRTAVRHESPISLIMIDIDHFKQINDTLGHKTGDDRLRSVAKAIVQCLRRPHDLAARYGGEEFAVLLPDVGAVGAEHVAHIIHDAVNALRLSCGATDCSKHVTISVGVASLTPGINDAASDLIERADHAMYMAKRQGRNRVCAFDNAHDPTDLPRRPETQARPMPASRIVTVQSSSAPKPTPPAAR